MNIPEQKLTAYALSELPPAESADVKAQLQHDPAAAQYVAEVRAAADTLTAALRDEQPVEEIDVDPIEQKLNHQPLFTFKRFALAASLLLAVGITIAALLPPSGGRSRLSDVAQAPFPPTPDISTALPAEQPTPPSTSSRDQVIETPSKPTDTDSRSQFGNLVQTRDMRAHKPQSTPSGDSVSETTSDYSELMTFPKEFPEIQHRRNDKVAEAKPAATPVPAGNKRVMQRQAAAQLQSVESGSIMNRPAPGVIIPPPPVPQPQPNTESYGHITDNPFTTVTDAPLSTFSIDVDTASYANVRRMLNNNQLPPAGAVRIEEFINYFDYDYPPEANSEHPFAMHVEIADAPWQPQHRLVKVGLKGKDLQRDTRPAANLVFLIDVSGSMRPANKLPLVQQSLTMLVDQLDETDTVGIVTYAGHAGVALQPTPASDKATIKNAITNLRSGGSTAGAQGIVTAYELAERYMKQGSANRVILATDGDFNVGITDNTQLTSLIEQKAKSGVFLSILGFGMGNLKDDRMEMLTNKGNGNYAYIDTLHEAKKVLVDQMVSNLVTIAKDVKIQVEFNPAVVHAYRLIGYENRMLAKEDFNDDTKDAGEIGAGHEVTALYEIVPVGAETTQGRPAVDPLKYQTPSKPAQPVIENPSNETLTLKLRYKQPDGDVSKLRIFAVTDAGRTLPGVSDDFRFAASVAAFGMILRGSPHVGDFTLADTLDLAGGGMTQDRHGYRAEFMTLVRKAQQLAQQR